MAAPREATGNAGSRFRPASLRPGVNVVQGPGDEVVLRRYRTHQAVAVSPGELESARVEPGHVNGDGVFDVDKALIGHRELNRKGVAVHGEIDFFAIEQGPYHAQVFLELGKAYRRLPHQPLGGVAGADAEKGPAGREAIDSRDTVGGDRCDTGTDDRYAGADADGAGLLSSQGHIGITVRPDHLTIGNPSVGVAEVLGVRYHPHIVNLGRNTNAKFHALPSSRSAKHQDY